MKSNHYQSHDTEYIYTELGSPELQADSLPAELPRNPIVVSP